MLRCNLDSSHSTKYLTFPISTSPSEKKKEMMLTPFLCTALKSTEENHYSKPCRVDYVILQNTE